ncbi:hypothetical protein CRUP_028188 [Coryphaenoides rupestris]|nr:hypothetical protein CRUP_028188 [Coryphaenoides rupestris]
MNPPEENTTHVSLHLYDRLAARKACAEAPPRRRRDSGATRPTTFTASERLGDTSSRARRPRVAPPPTPLSSGNNDWENPTGPGRWFIGLSGGVVGVVLSVAVAEEELQGGQRCRIENCESCFSRDFCTKCKSGFYLHKGHCLDKCPEGFAPLEDSMECGAHPNTSGLTLQRL